MPLFRSQWYSKRFNCGGLRLWCRHVKCKRVFFLFWLSWAKCQINCLVTPDDATLNTMSGEGALKCTRKRQLINLFSAKWGSRTAWDPPPSSSKKIDINLGRHLWWNLVIKWESGQVLVFNEVWRMQHHKASQMTIQALC